MNLAVEILKTAAHLEKQSTRLFAPHNLTAAQFNVLNLLSESSAGTRASDLAAALVVDPSNVTGLLKRMTRDGLVRDVPHDGDKRQRHVALSPKGRRLWEAAAKDYHSALANLEKEFSQREQATLLSLLGKVRETTSA